MVQEEAADFARPSDEQIQAFLEGTATGVDREAVLRAIDASPLFAEELIGLREEFEESRGAARGMKRWPIWGAGVAAVVLLSVLLLQVWIGQAPRYVLEQIETPITMRGTASAIAVTDESGALGIRMLLARQSSAPLVVILIDQNGAELESTRLPAAVRDSIDVFPRSASLRLGRRMTLRVFEGVEAGVRGEELARCAFVPSAQRDD
jgi:hypothetical protein